MLWLTYLFNRNVPLLECMVLTDGIINSINFTISYIYYKIKQNILKNDYVYTTEHRLTQLLIKQNNDLYKIHFIDRFMLYFFIHIVYYVIDFNRSGLVVNVSGATELVYYLISLSFTFPLVQNKLLDIEYIRKSYEKYCENKQILIHYSCSKFIVSLIQNLNNRIKLIPNYHIFIMYSHLTFSNLISFVKSYIFIYILYFLRGNESTYYYYKIVKFSYYGTTGYLFSNKTNTESIEIINDFINNKQWCNIHKVETVHAIYNLIQSKYKHQNNLETSLYIYVLKFFTLWNIICVLKIFREYINLIVLIVYLLVGEYWGLSVKRNKFLDRLKHYILGTITYILILFNTNDLFVTVFYVSYPLIYSIYEEVVFFIQNSYDIKKVLDFYNKRELYQKQMTKPEDTFHSSNIDDDYEIIY